MMAGMPVPPEKDSSISQWPMYTGYQPQGLRCAPSNPHTLQVETRVLHEIGKPRFSCFGDFSKDHGQDMVEAALALC